MVTEKKNFFFQMHNSFAKGKVISKYENDKPWNNEIGKVSAPPPF